MVRLDSPQVLDFGLQGRERIYEYVFVEAFIRQGFFVWQAKI